MKVEGCSCSGRYPTGAFAMKQEGMGMATASCRFRGASAQAGAANVFFLQSLCDSDSVLPEQVRSWKQEGRTWTLDTESCTSKPQAPHYEAPTRPAPYT